MEKSWWITRFFKWNFLIMKVTVELYGATKDLSKNNFLEFDLKINSSINFDYYLLDFLQSQLNLWMSLNLVLILNLSINTYL